MKKINVIVYDNGTSVKEQTDILFNLENYSCEVLIDFSKLTNFTDWIKNCDIIGTMGQKVHKVGDTSNKLKFYLTSNEVRGDYFVLYPFAKNGDYKVAFLPQKVSVNGFDNVLQDTVLVPSIAEQLQAQIDLKLTVHISELRDGDVVVFNSELNRFENKHLTLEDFTYGEL